MAVGFRVGVTEPHLRVAEENLKAHSHAPASAPRSPGARQAGGGHAPGAVSCAKALQERRKGTRHPGRAGRPEFGEGFLPKGGTRASFRVCHWTRPSDANQERGPQETGSGPRGGGGAGPGRGRGAGQPYPQGVVQAPAGLVQGLLGCVSGVAHSFQIIYVLQAESLLLSFLFPYLGQFL